MFGYLAIIPMSVFIFIWIDMMVKGKIFFNLIFALIFMLGVIGAGFAEAFFKINFATTLFVIVYLIMFIQIYIYMKYKQRNNEEEELKYNDNKESKIVEDIYPDMKSYYKAVNKYNEEDDDEYYYDGYGDRISKKKVKTDKDEKSGYEMNPLQIYENRLDEEDSKKKKTEEEAKKVKLPDAMYLIRQYNKTEFIQEKSKIDIFEFFADVDREEIEEWIEKVEKLIKYAPDFDNLSMSIMNAYRDADRERAKEYEEEMQVICKNFIRVNPGFSDNTYEKILGYREERL